MKIIVIMMQSHVIYAVILKKNRIYSAGYKSKKKQKTRGAFNHSKVRPCLWFYDAISLLYTNFQFHINAYGDL